MQFTLVGRAVGSRSCLWEREWETAYTSADRENGALRLETGLAIALETRPTHRGPFPPVRHYHLKVPQSVKTALPGGNEVSNQAMNLWEEPMGGAHGRSLWEEHIGGANGRSLWEEPMGGHSHSNLDSDLSKTQRGIDLPVYQKRLLGLLSGESGLLLKRRGMAWARRAPPTRLSRLRWSRHRNNATLHNRWICTVQ